MRHAYRHGRGWFAQDGRHFGPTHDTNLFEGATGPTLAGVDANPLVVSLPVQMIEWPAEAWSHTNAIEREGSSHD